MLIPWLTTGKSDFYGHYAELVIEVERTAILVIQLFCEKGHIKSS